MLKEKYNRFRVAFHAYQAVKPNSELIENVLLHQIMKIKE